MNKQFRGSKIVTSTNPSNFSNLLNEALIQAFQNEYVVDVQYSTVNISSHVEPTQVEQAVLYTALILHYSE